MVGWDGHVTASCSVEVRRGQSFVYTPSATCLANEVWGSVWHVREKQVSVGNIGQVNTWRHRWKILVKKWQLETGFFNFLLP